MLYFILSLYFWCPSKHDDEKRNFQYMLNVGHKKWIYLPCLLLRPLSPALTRIGCWEISSFISTLYFSFRTFIRIFSVYFRLFNVWRSCILWKSLVLECGDSSPAKKYISRWFMIASFGTFWMNILEQGIIQ